MMIYSPEATHSQETTERNIGSSARRGAATAASKKPRYLPLPTFPDRLWESASEGDTLVESTETLLEDPAARDLPADVAESLPDAAKCSMPQAAEAVAQEPGTLLAPGASAWTNRFAERGAVSCLLRIVLLAGLFGLSVWLLNSVRTAPWLLVDVHAGKITVTDESTLARHTWLIAPEATITRDGRPATATDLEAGDLVRLSVQTQAGQKQATQIVATSRQRAGQEFPLLLQTPRVFQARQSAESEAVESDDAGIARPVPETAVTPSSNGIGHQVLSASLSRELGPTARDSMGIRYSGTIVATGDYQLVLKTELGELVGFAVPDNVEITRDGRPCRLDQLERGDLANVLARSDAETPILVTSAIEAHSTRLSSPHLRRDRVASRAEREDIPLQLTVLPVKRVWFTTPRPSGNLGPVASSAMLSL